MAVKKIKFACYLLELNTEVWKKKYIFWKFGDSKVVLCSEVASWISRIITSPNSAESSTFVPKQ
jgi:hypothetical protein